MGAKVKVGPKYQVVIPQSVRKKISLLPKKEVLVEEIIGAMRLTGFLYKVERLCYVATGRTSHFSYHKQREEFP